jgi:hypothetical protein
VQRGPGDTHDRRAQLTRCATHTSVSRSGPSGQALRDDPARCVGRRSCGPSTTRNRFPFRRPNGGQDLV